MALWAFLHVVGWATYLGGALAMELIWRPAQEHIPGSQVNVLCQRMGQRYRWIAATSLAVVAVSGVARLVIDDLLGLWPLRFRDPLTLSDSYGRTMLAGLVCWALLVGLLATLTISAHPALHVRTPAEMSPEERAEARRQVGLAITRMDRVLRIDLVVAFVACLLGASLRFGGML